MGQAGEVGGESSYSELGSVIVWLRKGLGSGGEGLVFFMERFCESHLLTTGLPYLHGS